MDGEKVFAWRGWMGAVIVLPAVVAACLSPPLVRSGTIADAGLDILAWCILSGGIFVRLWATLYIGGRKSLSIVTGGPYALVRHPLYVGSFLIILSLAVFLKSLTVLAAVALIALVYACFVVPSEERHASKCFGAAYRTYAHATPRFLPRSVRLGRPGMIEVKAAAFLQEFARDFGCIMIAAAAQLCAHLRLQPWWPTPFCLP